MGSVYGHFLFCTILYLRVPIILCPCYSFSLVYAGKHLYEKYLNNEQYEKNVISSDAKVYLGSIL